MMNQPDVIINGKSIANLRGKITRHIMMFKTGTVELCAGVLPMCMSDREITVNIRNTLMHRRSPRERSSLHCAEERCCKNITKVDSQKSKGYTCDRLYQNYSIASNKHTTLWFS